MGTISKGYTFSSNTTISPSEVNSNFDTIYNEFNGAISAANLATSAITTAKIADSNVTTAKIADSNVTSAKLSSDLVQGWISVSDSWSYASSTTVTVPSGATSKYSVGDKVQFVQTTTKYFKVTAVASTTLTLAGIDGVTVANAAISSIYYSHSNTPVGFSSAWQSWTPTWTNFTTGNGTLNYAKFIQIGKTVHFRVKFTLGSTSAVTGAARFTVPVTMNSDYLSGDIILGTGRLTDSGVLSFFATMEVNDTSSVNILVHNSTASTYLRSWNGTSSTIPFTWGTSDVIFLSGTYEAA